MGEWRGRTWGVGDVGETGPVSDKGRYNQVITSDKIEEEKGKRGRVLGERGRGVMKPVRGPPDSIRERQRIRDSQSGIRCTRGKYGRKITDTGNISESNFNENDESFRGFP